MAMDYLPRSWFGCSVCYVLERLDLLSVYVALVIRDIWEDLSTGRCTWLGCDNK